MAKFLSSAQALDHINERLTNPISKTQFRTIYELMVKRGDATPPQERQGGWVLTEYIWQWSVYLSTRESLIAASKWPPKRAYSIEDMEDIAISDMYEEYQPNEHKNMHTMRKE